jgi:hypothetical protein
MKAKSLLLLLMLTLMVGYGYAQKDKSKRPSPPAVAEGTIDGVKVKIDYSQPSVKGRKIFGGLEKYGEVWRTGANEATVIEFDKAVKIEGKELPAGKYALFSIPGENEWTVIFNSVWETWGAYDYSKNKDKDVLKVKVKPSKTDLTEKLTFTVGKDNVTFKWENTAVSFKVKG